MTLLSRYYESAWNYFENSNAHLLLRLTVTECFPRDTSLNYLIYVLDWSTTFSWGKGSWQIFGPQSDSWRVPVCKLRDEILEMWARVSYIQTRSITLNTCIFPLPSYKDVMLWNDKIKSNKNKSQSNIKKWNRSDMPSVQNINTEYEYEGNSI